MKLSMEEIWSQFNQILLNFIQSKVSNKHDAEDILQNVFIKIYKNIDDLKTETKLESWIFQITRNAIIDYYRARKTDFLLAEVEEICELPPETEKNMNQKISLCLSDLIEELPKKYQEPLNLYEFKNHKHKEISKKLNISVSGSKTRVQRARIKLKEMLIKCCDFELDVYGNIINYNPKCSCHEEK